MQHELQAIATILSLVNPAMCAAIFMRVGQDQSAQSRFVEATKAMLVVLAILLVSAFAGAQVLHLFGVSLDAFSVAGGGVLVWIGIAMLTGRESASAANHGAKKGQAARNSLAPLILFAASPGTITGVITISVAHSKLDFPVTAIIAIAIVVALTWVLLVLTARMPHAKSGDGIAREMITRYMGLIVIAMGIQFMLTGYRAFMAAG